VAQLGCHIVRQRHLPPAARRKRGVRALARDDLRQAVGWWVGRRVSGQLSFAC
jgi:hypothetical protein